MKSSRVVQLAERQFGTLAKSLLVRFAGIGFLVIATMPGAETVYKCVSENGEISFQQARCSPSERSTSLEVKNRAPGEPSKPQPVALEEQHYQRLLEEYEAQQQAFERDTAARTTGRSEEEIAVEHLRNRRAVQLGISRQELDRREGWKPRAR